VELPREHVLAGSEWADLAVALEGLKGKKRIQWLGEEERKNLKFVFKA